MRTYNLNTKTKPMKKLLLSTALLLALSFTFTSCRDTKKESVEDSIENAGDAIEDAADAAAEAIEDAGEEASDAVEDALESAGDAVDDAAKATSDAIKK